ncbi:gluconokinase [Nocardia huaxiensis]|uniref:Gluconokinase n=1 Tax=Nocardia huaxiensis TaxID=2755382 RepID=A0A7D6V7G2_9NOCA|nr:gluconokinase [Nocardia huaxiensis]QLY28534.1 gluconokinase [Nocardia huaxiensis]
MPATIVVVMGVSGTGKSTVARALSTTLGWDLLEGDDLHPAANIAKMSAGHPLTDADRRPWLESIAHWIADHAATGASAVITCSALKKTYRDILRHSVTAHPTTELLFLYLHGTRPLLALRTTTRTGHFMPPALLDSQLATLEDPRSEPDVLTIDVAGTPRQVEAAALTALRDRLGS